MAEDPGSVDLEKVDHIVVLMMENRSFDHMLGYLSLESGRDDVDGLRPGMANEHGGHSYPVHPLGTTVTAEDPDHCASAVDMQIGGGTMDGFVASYAAALQSRGVKESPAAVMGYHGAADVPVFDHLAREFAVCDRWFSSVPGATWPNRLYALCGRAAGSRDCHPHNLPPLYNKPSFARHLDAHGVSWRWYSSDVGTLRMADQRYCLGHHDRFAYFTKTGLSPKHRLNIRVNSEYASFLEDAARGTLPSVSWIDPSWGDFNPFGFRENDDHPPADIADGQDLVLTVYHALATSPQWDKTLLIIFYDEHGGFFDHVPPPEADDDDPQTFGRYGVRVPALIVSPWTKRGSVSHTLFDHTSVIKTILLRFCANGLQQHSRPEHQGTWRRAGHPHYMGTRVAHASDLAEFLTNPAPRPAPAHDALTASAAARADEQDQDPATGKHEPDRQPSTDWQAHIAAAAHLLRSRGHPAGRT